MLILNKLTFHGKRFLQREIIRKFMLVMSGHLENRVVYISEKLDLHSKSLEKLYRKLKTYNMELKQRRINYGPDSLENNNPTIQKIVVLFVEEPVVFKAKEGASNPEIYEDKTEFVSVDSVDDYYTLEELD